MVKMLTLVKSTVLMEKRTGPIDDMKKMLSMWMEDQIDTQECSA
jgi:Zn ribbon nucleic-acid-binding protein